MELAPREKDKRLILTAAMLDRLLHHDNVVPIQGDSFLLLDKRRAGLMMKKASPEREVVLA